MNEGIACAAHRRAVASESLCRPDRTGVLVIPDARLLYRSGKPADGICEALGHIGDLLRTLLPTLERLDSTVRQIRQSAGRKSVAITTWASFASMWLIPRLEAFQRSHPDIDIRIDATDTAVDLETADIDLALRYSLPGASVRGAQRLFGEQLAVVASPWLLKSGQPIRKPADVAKFTLIGSAVLTVLTWIVALVVR